MWSAQGPHLQSMKSVARHELGVESRSDCCLSGPSCLCLWTSQSIPVSLLFPPNAQSMAHGIHTVNKTAVITCRRLWCVGHVTLQSLARGEVHSYYLRMSVHHLGCEWKLWCTTGECAPGLPLTGLVQGLTWVNS